jgi:hypothetical protein
MKNIGTACLAALLAATPLSAQFARGIITERDSGAPLNGAFVVLLDAAGRQRNAVLSDDRGNYVMRAPEAGAFRIRAELIGHESVITPRFDVPAAGPAIVNVQLGVAAIELAAVEASAGDRRCVARPESGKQTARLWEEARKALAVTSWTAKQDGVAEFRTRTYDRELALGSLAMVWQGVRSGYTQARPYAAVSPDSLAAYGFVRTVTADSVMYFGPDAETLLSDVFLDTHCFDARRGEGDAAGLIGLGFSPVRGRKLADINGTLWLDPRSSELKYIEFTYTGISAELNVRGVGGRTDFRRLPNGAWIVDRWYIRLPIPRRGLQGHLVAAALLEGGGEIVDVKIAGNSVPKATITGVVHDSINGRPLARAYVYLSGTAYSTVTDSAGRFEIRDVVRGNYMVAFGSPEFDALPSLPQAQRLTVEAPQDMHIELALPSAATLITRACAGSGSGGVIFGALQPDERVQLTYKRDGRTVARGADGDKAGRYMLCGLPVGAKVNITFPGAEPRPAQVPRAGYIRIDQGTP